MNVSPHKALAAIAVITAISLYIALPNSLNFGFFSNDISKPLTKRTVDTLIFGKRIVFNPQIKLGLDLQGGTHLILDADMSEISSADRITALQSAQEIIRRRVDLFGVAEPVIQTSIQPEKDQFRLIVELPGITNTQEAIALIGQTAQLEFRELAATLDDQPASSSSQEILENFTQTNLTGKELKRATIQFDHQSQPTVALEFTKEGAQMFAEITQRNIGNPVGIFLDQVPLTLPIVQTQITNGQAVISGNFDTQTATNLSIQLNAGALPVPIEIVSQRNIGATLGKESVQKSFIAGVVGLTMVMFFMAAYYKHAGILADIALIVYGLITLALYKLLGITLTLPGLAGFILSVGMAVDSNILIFERIKEELRSGKKVTQALELGFGRAWDSIKDANVATLTISFILFNPFDWSFLNSSGMVRGFALTLTLGIFISLFTGIIVTRTLMRLFYKPQTTP